MRRVDRLIISPLLAVFLLHGLFYYIYPEAHYQSDRTDAGWIVFIKYLCLAISIPFLISYRFSRDRAYWFAAGLIPIVLSVPSTVHWINSTNTLLLQYQIAILGFFFAPFLARLGRKPVAVKIALYSILVVSFAATAHDILSGGVISNFSRSGLRASGPFVNPNNTGILTALAGTSLHFMSKRRLEDFLIAIFCVATITFVGSKTAAVLYAIGLTFSTSTKSKTLFAICAFFAAGVFSKHIYEYFQSLDLRIFSLESGAIRAENFSDFIFGLGKEGALGLLFGESRTSSVDNAYLDIVGFGGVVSLIVFLTFQIATICFLFRKKMRLALLIFCLLAVAMITTNIPRLWPTGYLYWSIVGLAILRATDRQALRTNLRPAPRLESTIVHP